MTTYSGERNPNWKGGRTVDPRGYVLIKKPDHPRADVRGYVYEHVLVAEKELGRSLEPWEEVHHKNRDKGDNDPSNLEATTGKADHRYRHRTSGKVRRMEFDENELIECPCGCGTWFERFDRMGRIRRYVSGHNTGGRSRTRT